MDQIEREDAERAKKYAHRGEVLANEVDSEDEDEDKDQSQQQPQSQQIDSSSKVQIKYQAMTKAICDVVNDYALVSFYPMNVEDVSVSCIFYCFCVVKKTPTK